MEYFGAFGFVSLRRGGGAGGGGFEGIAIEWRLRQG